MIGLDTFLTSSTSLAVHTEIVSSTRRIQMISNYHENNGKLSLFFSVNPGFHSDISLVSTQTFRSEFLTTKNVQTNLLAPQHPSVDTCLCKRVSVTTIPMIRRKKVGMTFVSLIFADEISLATSVSGNLA